MTGMTKLVADERTAVDLRTEIFQLTKLRDLTLGGRVVYRDQLNPLSGRPFWTYSDAGMV